MARIGFLVWNRFQVAHTAEIARHFDEPDFIFINRDEAALAEFDPNWLVPYGAYCRFLAETSLHTLDGDYDVIVSQFRPPLREPWRKTKLVIQQYSLAKPKTAYNGRWFAADLGLVYGNFSADVIGSMCPVEAAGNARFDPFFEERLDARLLGIVRSRIDEQRKTILYLPTWGDLNTSESVFPVLQDLAQEYNVLVRPHHLSPLREDQNTELPPGVISTETFPQMLDLTLYLMSVSDVVVSDMSGAIFDALYCRKPVVILGDSDLSYAEHQKADDDALEVARRDMIGQYATNGIELRRALEDLWETPDLFTERNERLVGDCFVQRGHCAQLAADAIRKTIDTGWERPELQRYAAADFVPSMLARSVSAAKKRNVAARRLKQQQLALTENQHRAAAVLARLERRSGLIGWTSKQLRTSFGFLCRQLAVGAERSGNSMLAASLHRTAVVEFGDNLHSALWSAEHEEERGNDALAFRYYSRARGRSPVARSQFVRLLVKKGDFFGTGREIEIWSRQTQQVRVRSLYQTLNSVSAVRFSRMRWRVLLAKLFRGNYSISATSGIRLLRSIGMVRTSEYLSIGDVATVDDGFLTELFRSIGVLAEYLDLAARNDLAPPEQQVCITPGGEYLPLADVEPGQTIELYLLLSLTRVMADERRAPYREALVEFSQNLVMVMPKLGFNLLPRIQSGIIGATPVSSRYRALTWHTLRSEFPGQIHLKIGTLHGHFVVDNAGHGGWSSLAEKPIEEVIAGVDPIDADDHWKSLYRDLVEEGKSKYAQSSEVTSTWGAYLFLPMQVVDDIVATLADIDCYQLLKILGSWAQSSEYSVVVKRHPMCQSQDVEEAIEEARREGWIQVSNANIHDLISGAECVVTVNSGVGAEALLHLKPVVTTGGSDYAAATVRVRSSDELLDVLNSQSWKRHDEDQLKRFLWYYTKRYMVASSDVDGLTLRLKALLGQNTAEIRGEFIAPKAPVDRGIPFVALDSGIGTLPEEIEALSLGRQCDQLLGAFRDTDVRCWLDSGSLLGYVREGRLNSWEKDIDLGIWATDFEAARKICREIADRFGLLYREKWVQDVPYALLLSRGSNRDLKMLPISVHLFFRFGDRAWSMQPHSLVAAQSKYPRYIYRESIGEHKGSVLQKAGFVLKYPRYTFAMGIAKFRRTQNIGKRLRRIERGESISDRMYQWLFLEMFQWDIPARFFDDLQPLDEVSTHILIPEPVEEYLVERYGDWRVPVQDWYYLVDDGCISIQPGGELPARLRHAAGQLDMPN